MADLAPPEQLLLILGMTVVTFIPRVAPLMLLSSRNLNPLFMRWLEMVPPAVLAALLAPELFLTTDSDGGKVLFASLDNVFMLAAVPAFLVGCLSRSFFSTIIAGMGAVALLRHFM